MALHNRFVRRAKGEDIALNLTFPLRELTFPLLPHDGTFTAENDTMIASFGSADAAGAGPFVPEPFTRIAEKESARVLLSSPATAPYATTWRRTSRLSRRS